MKILNYSPQQIVIGKGSLEYLRHVQADRVMIITGAGSMVKSGVIARIREYMRAAGSILVHDGIQADPTFEEVEAGLTAMREFRPDTIVAVGGGSALDAAKAMMLFYEFPHLDMSRILEEKIPDKREKTTLIAIPSTSGTGSEVTRTTVITDVAKGIKIPIIHICLKPDICILDSDLAMTMPDRIVAETGMDALTHAIECYTRHDLDDFNEVLAKGAIEGIMKWLPVSYAERTPESRAKMHNYQCMAGMSFGNVGVAVVHGIAHAVGAHFHMAHGLANAIILPHALIFNREDPVVDGKLVYLSRLCECADIVDAIRDMAVQLGIPLTLQAAGIKEADFLNDLDRLAAHSMLGATRFNPVAMSDNTMRTLLQTIFYGRKIGGICKKA
ncbi:MAG: iron-containing alcohol dehydrogenase [Planctomycetaceae bacterium]|nr:iron-containing alcohol dehydrogenase [Planctomycetaceae bacterium]